MTVISSEGSVIPKNYDDLLKQYGPLIYKLLLKYNKVERNFDDLHSYVWVKILEASLLDRFEEHIQKQTPKVLNALEACDLLGVSWRQWSTAMWAFHKGDPSQYNKEGKVIARKRGRWMPTPINLAEFQARGLAGYSAKTALFDFNDIIKLSTDETRFKTGRIRKAFRLMGRSIKPDQGTIVSEERPEGLVKLPEVTVTKAQFRNYLTMSVLNHYANFCRTAERRHKERPYTPPSYLSEDEAPSWESTLQDCTSPDADTIVALAEAKQMLSATLHECMEDVPTCRPVAEQEIDMFKMLDEGIPLNQVLGKLGLPNRVKSDLIDTIRPLAPEFISGI